MKNLLLLLLFITMTVTSYAGDFNDSVKQTMINTSVKIMSVNGDHGSGTIVMSKPGAAIVLTNRHVCMSMVNTTITDTFGVIFYQEKIYRAKIVAIAKNSDLCLMMIKNKAVLPYATISPDSKNTLGDEVISLGYPADHNKFITSGYIGEGYKILGGMRYLETSLVAIGGQSGSAVFNKKGLIVGVLSLGTQGAVVLSGLVDLPSIQQFLLTGE